MVVPEVEAVVSDTEPQDQDQILQYARDFVRHLEENNREEADKCMGQLTDLRERELFKELGKLTREFHNALTSFRCDERIADIAADDIPDAKERLNYVITRTADAAHRTLNAVEASMPACDTLADAARQLSGEWQRFTTRQMSPQDFRGLSKQIDAFLIRTSSETETIKNHLNDVLLAQDFQDITGQIIKRVINLVEEVEESLVNLIRLGGGQIVGKKTEHDPAELDGPPVPGLAADSTVSGQDEVDDLLSSLGF